MIRQWERVAWDDAPGILGRVLSGCLLPAGLLYGFCSERIGKSRARTARTLPCPVISVGNLTVGGSGKTPFTAFLSALIAEKWNLRTAVLSRGYGKRNPNEITVVSDGAGMQSSCEESGDEAFQIAHRIPGTLVLTGANRHAAGLIACETYDAEVILLDDGFQHQALQRQLNLVMVDSERGFGNKRCFPAGPLREPFSALERADWIVLYRRSFAERERILLDLLPQELSGKEILEVRAEPTTLFLLDRTSGSVKPGVQTSPLGIEQAKTTKWLLVSGIANPKSFEQAVWRLGISFSRHLSFHDHYIYRESDWNMILQVMIDSGCDGILTTEKDIWKLADTPLVQEKEKPLLTALRLELTLGSGKENFIKKLESILSSPTTGGSSTAGSLLSNV